MAGSSRPVLREKDWMVRLPACYPVFADEVPTKLRGGADDERQQQLRTSTRSNFHFWSSWPQTRMVH